MELNETTFLLVVAGYVIGGLASLAVGVTGLGASSTGSRIVAMVVGVASVVYAAYLFFMPGESVWIVPYLLLLPVILVVKAVQAAVGGRQRTA